MAKRKWLMGIMSPNNVPESIWIKLDVYDPEMNKILKAELPAPARFDRDYKVWLFPLSWDTCLKSRKVADKYGADIAIAPDLAKWAQEEKQRQESIPDVQSMALVELPRVRVEAPAIWEAVRSRPFQTVGAAFAARNGSCLIADQPGLGKTVQSIAAIIESGINGPILVVAPKSAAKLTWPQELKRWVPEDVVVVIGNNLKPTERIRAAEAIRDYKMGPHANQRIWVLTSPNYVRIKAEVDEYGKYKYQNGQKILKPVQEGILELFDIEWSALIVDESHQTLAGASGDKKKQSAQRVGLGALEVKKDGLRIALSGTPFRGKEEYLWGQLNWLKPELFRSRWKWINDHFDVHQDRYGMVIGGMIDRQAMYKEASTVMIRRTKAEVAKDLPPKLYCDIWLDMEPKQEATYREMEKKAQADLDGGMLITTGILAELTRLKQFAGSHGKMVDDHFTPSLPSNKFEWLCEFLDERGIDVAMGNNGPTADVPKIVVASQFSQLINVIHHGLIDQGIASHVFTGETSDKKREEIKDDWQNNQYSKTRVLLLTTTAGGVSLTLDAASDLVELDETWNTSDQEQLEDRLHRLSRIHQVTIWRVRSNNTIEESIAKNNEVREMSIKDIIDGSRGIDFAKNILDHP